MKLIVADRASSIIYNIVAKTNNENKYWLLPTNVCHTVPAAIIKGGGKIKFFDVSPISYCMNEEKVLNFVMKNKELVAGIIYVKTYGIELSIKDFYLQIKGISKSILVIDDKCLCIPHINLSDEYTEADATIYSTGYSKFIDIGKGGYGILTDNYYESYDAVSISGLQYDKKDEDEFNQYFSKCISKKGNKIIPIELKKHCLLDWLGEENGIKEYEENLAEIISRVQERQGWTNAINKIYNSYLYDFNLSSKLNNWRYNILVDNVDFVIDKLKENNLFASNHYFPIAQIFDSGYEKNSFIWDTIHPKIINLFNDYRYNIDMAEKTSEIVLKYGKFTSIKK